MQGQKRKTPGSEVKSKSKPGLGDNLLGFKILTKDAKAEPSEPAEKKRKNADVAHEVPCRGALHDTCLLGK